MGRHFHYHSVAIDLSLIFHNRSCSFIHFNNCNTGCISCNYPLASDSFSQGGNVLPSWINKLLISSMLFWWKYIYIYIYTHINFICSKRRFVHCYSKFYVLGWSSVNLVVWFKNYFSCLFHWPIPQEIRFSKKLCREYEWYEEKQVR